MDFMAILRALLLLSFFPIPSTQQVKNASPDPAKIANAKSVFVSNVGDATGDSADEPYNYLYSALQHWGRHGIVLDPADATWS